MFSNEDSLVKRYEWGVVNPYMKWFLILNLILCSATFAVEKSEKAVKKSFSVKKILEDKSKFSKLVEKTVIAGQVDSREKAHALIGRATASLPVKDHFNSNPIYGEVLYQTSQNPDALVSLFSIFLEKTKIVQFFLLLVGSLYLSHLMGEAKYFMKPFGFGRLFYGIFRFGFINSVRLGGFIYLFKANLAPVGNVLVQSATQVAVDYPLLIKATHLFNNVLSTSVSF